MMRHIYYCRLIIIDVAAACLSGVWNKSERDPRNDGGFVGEDFRYGH
jgi:hypothetical protein